jgi:hypothetical protein
MHNPRRLGPQRKACLTVAALLAVMAHAAPDAGAQSPVYPKRIEVTAPTGPFLPPIPLQAYVEYAFRRIDVTDASVPSRADQHGAAAGADFMWTPRAFSGLRFNYTRGNDDGRTADGISTRAQSDAYGASAYISGFVAPPFLGGGVQFGLERTLGKTRLGDGRDRADRGRRYFVSPFVALAYPIGPVRFGVQPRATFQWEELRFRRDEANNRDNTDIDVALRLSAEWQVTQRFGLSVAATPTWVLVTPHSTNLPARDRFSLTVEAGGRVWLGDQLALYARYNHRVLDSTFRTQSVIVGLSYAFLPRQPIVVPAPDPTRPLPN